MPGKTVDTADILRLVHISPGAAALLGSGGGIGGCLPPPVFSAVSDFRLILWQMRDPLRGRRTRILVLLNKGTPVKIRDTAARAEVL